jgi:NAD+ kinase
MSITKVGVIANSSKESAVEYTCRLSEWLVKKKVEVFLEEEIAAKAGITPGINREDLASIVDIIVVFGGDGTLLVASRSLKGLDVPIVGINLGGLGFLTVVNLNEMFSAMELILKGKYKTSKRMMLDAIFQAEDGQGIEKKSVLNDIVINRGDLGRMIHLKTFVDDKYLTTFKADGLIISTPTGSTAYSLSSGGPIVFPELNSIIINPICPHTLTNRPIMLPPNVTIKIVLWTKKKCATVTLDGQGSHIVKPGGTIEVKKSNDYINLVDSPYRDYLEILRTKLGWGGLP